MGWWDRLVEGMEDVFGDLEDEFGEDEQDEILTGDDVVAAEFAADALLEGSIETLSNPESWRSGE